MEDLIKKVIAFARKKPECSSKEIYESLTLEISYATVKRLLSRLVSERLLETKGQGRATKYIISPNYELIYPIDAEDYYEKDIDEREIKQNFNFELINDILPTSTIFSEAELEKLSALHNTYTKNVAQLSDFEYKKELERLAIDLSWKSSQIEGNTYSLLETERLLKDKETASGKTKEEATMLLNHKEAIDFITKNTQYIHPLTVSKIESIHSILVQELPIKRNLRTARVGISGTNYRPLDNEFQIRDALSDLCNLVNSKEDIFEKALLALVLISYIQPFVDGNKRTSRIISNGILMNSHYCPLSFRTVDSIDYKKAMLIFYEQNNISSFKQIFIDQFEFAVKTYF